MASLRLIAILLVVAGFLAFGGLQLTKNAVKEVKEKSDSIKSKTQTKIDNIMSEDT